MKQAKRLTRSQKECLSAYHLNAKNWMLVKESDFYITVINKDTRKTKILDKFRR